MALTHEKNTCHGTSVRTRSKNIKKIDTRIRLKLNRFKKKRKKIRRPQEKSGNLDFPKIKRANLATARLTLYGGERGIRTPGTFQYNGFQDRRIRPLCHLSNTTFCVYVFVTQQGIEPWTHRLRVCCSTS